MSLKEYRKKRSFDGTPEPRGAPRVGKRSKQPTFVVQKHQASRLHYDFRLEVDGVLASWAVPKGPSLDPRDRRLAVQVEDHPIEYANFEGVISKGHYGAGTVMVWDIGKYQTESSEPAAAQIQRGEIKFVLDGEKLRGGFVLVRLNGRPQRTGAAKNAKNWLLIKHRDEFAVHPFDIERYPESALTGRDMDEIGANLHQGSEHVRKIARR